MKHFTILFLLSLLLVSCQKDNHETTNVEIPEWLKPRIREIQDSGTCILCNITRFTYHKEYYYSVYCAHWSCYMCEMYDSEGTRIENEEQLDLEDFLDNYTDETIIWHCTQTLQE